MFKKTAIYLIFFGMMCATQAPAQETPDELYRQGRFAEAEKAYALSDMDHPKDIRYRYNRGCAAYQGADYQGATAAFSSVLRRAKDDDMRFRASYNLGNTAFKQGDFESAATYYKQALRYNPTYEDARHNLELALKELDKQKEKKDEKSQSESGTQPKEDSEQSEEKGDDSDPDQKGKNQDKQGQEKPSEQESQQARDKGEEERQTGSEQTRETGEDEESPQDLSGELKAQQSPPEGEEKENASEQAMSMIDRKKAEALLDNIKEDRSRFLQFLVPKEKRQGVESGKDW
jgi:Ca-activated chloride channel family protein